MPRSDWSGFARLPWSQTYWSRRMSGEVPLDVTDLADLARVTGVAITDLVAGAA